MPRVVLLARVLEKVSLGMLASAMGMKLHRVMETRKTMPGYGGVKGYRLYDGKLYLGFHATKPGATKALKEAQGCKPQRQRSIPRPILRFKGIRTRRGKDGTWSYHAVCRVPNDRGKTYLGSAKNIKEVAAMVADYHGVSIQQKVRPKSERVQPKVSADRFKVLMSAFNGRVPADVADAVSLRQADPWLCVVAPGIHVGALMGKEAPWRAAVLKAWQNTPDRQRWQIAGLQSQDEALQAAGAKAMFEIFSRSFDTWAKLVGKGVHPGFSRQFWQEHVSRNVHFHLSLCPWALHKGLLQKQSHKAGSLGVQVEGTQEYYKKCSFSQSEHVPPMMLLHKTGMLLQGLEIPRNNHDWLQSTQQATKTADAWGIPTPAYHWP